MSGEERPAPDRPDRRGALARVREALRDPKAAFAGAVLHDRMHPTLIEFYRKSACQTVSPSELLEALLGHPVEPDRYRPELEEIRHDLDDRLRAELSFRLATRLSDPQSLLLYALIRELRPSTVFETGVANGYSSAILLQALEVNGAGTLWSVDISSEVGSLVPPRLRHRWKLRILPRRGERRAFRSVLEEAGPIDVFEHDSDHGYAWQRFELESAWAHMRDRGILSVDDADWSWATLDFAEANNVPLLTFLTPTRVFGLFRHP